MYISRIYTFNTHTPEGWQDGCEEGCCDGCREGRIDGCDEGCLDGWPDGTRGSERRREREGKGDKGSEVKHKMRVTSWI